MNVNHSEAKARLPDRVVEELAEIAFANDTDTRAGDRLRALELLGKHYGLFREAEQEDVTADEALYELILELRGIREKHGKGREPS